MSRSVCRGWFFLALVSAAYVSSIAWPREVVLDGRFDDWIGAPLVVDDPVDADGPLDIGAVHALADPDWLFLDIDLRREVNAQSLPGTLHLILDVDPGAATGATVFGMADVDFVLECSTGADWDAAVRGVGFALRPVSDAGILPPVSPYALGVVVSPVSSSARFELRISRKGAVGDGLRPMGGTIRFKAVYAEGQTVRDETSVAGYTFAALDELPASGATPAPIGQLAKAERSTRVAQWNVSGESFRLRPEGFARILAALDADVLLLNELPGDLTDDDLAAFFAREEMRARGDWHFVLGAAGGRQRAAVAGRNLKTRPAEGLRDVQYAPGALDRLRETVPEAFHAAIELERVRGLSAAGAWVEVGRREVLFVALDLQSTGWSGSPEDLLRIVQARTLRDRIATERASHGLVVIGGDLNLVGSQQPLLDLQRELDVAGADLTPVEARRLGEPTTVTWRNAVTPFAPGRLDFVLVPASATDVARSFVFATEDLDGPALEALGLEASLSNGLSDHLLVVADLTFR